MARLPGKAGLDRRQPEFPVLEAILTVVIEAHAAVEDVDRNHRSRVADIVRDAVDQPGIAVAVMGAPVHRECIDIRVNPPCLAGGKTAVKCIHSIGLDAIVSIQKIYCLCFG